MPRQYAEPLKRKGALFSNVTAGTVAKSWIYQRAVGMLNRDGLTKREIVRRLKAEQAADPGAPKYSDVTINYYLKAAARFGLLDAAGVSQFRKYYPPGYLTSAKRDNQRQAKENEKSVLSILQARAREAQQESGSPSSTES
jgi:hypothetical protein